LLSVSDEVVVFDFDGTVADTVALSFKIYNQLSEEFGYKKLAGREQYLELFHKSAPAVIKAIGLSPLKLPRLASEGKRLFRENLDQVKVFKGLAEVLAQLAKSHRLVIISSNLRELIEEFLERHGLRQYFELVLGAEGGESKFKLLKHYLAQSGGRPEDAWLVCDTTRDVKDGKKLGMKVIAVTWGYHHLEVLKRERPDFMVDRPEELLQIIEEQGEGNFP